jgi:gamma-glutamylcyclotransferase (GGCT)/AIG2-like uncharacterized protein YtfP
VNRHLVFVYGTLRRGGVRSMPELFRGAKLVGEASVKGSLYDLGPHPLLLLEESEGSGSSVLGELYEVDEGLLNELDEMEASSDYLRRRAEVSLGGRTLTCWTYAPDPESFPDRTLIASGDWIEYAGTKTARPEDARPDEN